MIITKTYMLIAHILQVIHDCRAIAGCLIAQFGVKLTNVFDTQVHVQYFRWQTFSHVCLSIIIACFCFYMCFRLQMSCASPLRLEVSSPIESVLCRRLLVSI